MKTYKIKSENTKLFSLTMHEQEIGTLKYEKWFSFNAETHVEGFGNFQIEPKGFWGTTIELRQQDTVVANFKMNWSGNIIINTMFDGIERDFILKHKGIFKDSYVLLNKEEEQLLMIKPDFKWNKLRYDYDIATTDEFDKLSFNKLLLLTTIHCVNHYVAMMSSGMV